MKNVEFKTKRSGLLFIPVTKENIILATETEMKFWPNNCAYNSYLRAYEKGKPYWLVYKNNEIVGLSGIYESAELGEPETAWLGWFGVLEDYRHLGYGSEILEQTLEVARSQGFTKLRLYSSKRDDFCPNALPFYKKLSAKYNGFVEDYTLEQLEMQRIVVSFSLNNKEISKWNNRNLHLDDDRNENKDSLQNYLKEKSLL